MNQFKQRYIANILAKKRKEAAAIKKMDFTSITDSLKRQVESKKDIITPF